MHCQCRPALETLHSPLAALLIELQSHNLLRWLNLWTWVSYSWQNSEISHRQSKTKFGYTRIRIWVGEIRRRMFYTLTQWLFDGIIGNDKIYKKVINLYIFAINYRTNFCILRLPWPLRTLWQPLWAFSEVKSSIEAWLLKRFFFKCT